MASAERPACSPYDIYIENIDTSKILIAKTLKECLPDDSDLIPMIEDCCFNSVTATYRHNEVDQLAIILFQHQITGLDIQQCQEELMERAPDVFVFEIEPRPLGLVVINRYDFDSKQLNAYIKNRKSGIGPEEYQEAPYQEGVLLIVRVRNTEKVLRQVFSRTHTISGQSVYFQPYFPCFHDTLTELLGTSDPRNPVQPSRETTMYPGTPYPDTEPTQWSHRHSQRDRSYSPEDDDGRCDFERCRSPEVRRGGHDDNYHFPGDGGRGDYYLPPGDGKRDYRYHSPGDRRRPERYDVPGDGRRDDRHYSPRIPHPGFDDGAWKGDFEEDGVNSTDSRRYPDVAEDDDPTEGEKETTKIKTSSICDDDEEKKMVSVCLESSIGKQFLDKFRKDNDCEIDVKFKKKAIKPIRTHATSDTTSGTDRKPTRDVSHTLGMMFPLFSLEPGLGNITTICIDQDRPIRHSRARPVDRSDTINISGTKLTVKKGDVSLEKADVLVNVVGDSLELQTGLISKAYAKRGGDELTQAYQTAMLVYDGNGTIGCDGGKLSCKHLITMVLPQRQNSSSDQKFTIILESVFKKAADLGFGTIVLPVMGCGKMLQYPLHSAIAITMDTTVKVLKSSKKPLKEVTIVAFDDKTYDELAKELHKGTHKTKTATSQSRASKETVGCSIELSACGSRKVNRLKKELTGAMKAEFLSTNNVKIPTSISIRTKTKLYNIAEEHTKTPMKMEFDQSGKHVVLKGEKTQVSKTAKHLTSMLSSGDSSKIRKPLRCSPSSWFKLAHDSPISPPYWTKFKANTPLTVLSKNSRAVKRWSVVPVDASTKKAIESLVQTTWDNKLVGQGRDAVNLRHKRIKVDKVERIENIDVYNRYATKRQEQFRMLAEEGATALRSLENIRVQTKGAIDTSPTNGAILYDDIFPEINEHYLFHGTKPEIVQTVIQQGLDCRMSDEKAMFGMGIYGAETSTKADQYADHKQQRSPGSKTMLLVRMLLGNMFVCKDPNPTKYRRPPCRSTTCLKDKCTCGHGHFDSVVGDGNWLFREFVVYAAEQCYPEYLITYHRE
ncbi:uncharacterized protein LOC110449500 isoform X2 [Mizuhopecten yessoensis]|uniref:uncharacterized protein LOC110449500 isoform X2 n=1 Tax=Mizuhopecten yessoensis TaxID=6573 RepID=UPI000B45E59A|nr:uncharacterized protein LOC110449500 isoform X2 [Mizuhopecten yessoensis]